MKLVLIRHGRTRANEEMLYCGSTDLPISPGGLAELREKRARGGYPDPAGFHIYTSGMLRTEQTLQALFGELPHDVIRDLREIDFGDFEMRGYTELQNDAAYRAWCEGDNEAKAAPGGESGTMVLERALRGLGMLLRRNEDALVITHGGITSAVMGQLCPKAQRNRYDWMADNGEGYCIEFADGQAQRWEKLPVL